MTVQTSLQELWGRLHALRDALLALRLIAVEDRPREGRTAFSDRFADEAEELTAAVEEALHVVGGALAHHEDIEAARGALTISHDRIAHAARAYWMALGADRRQVELLRLARRGGPPWRGWVESVLAAAEPCTNALAAADAAARAAWDELVQRAAGSLVRVDATAVGQQISVGRGRDGAPAQTGAGCVTEKIQDEEEPT